METKPFSLQSPEQIAKDYGGNKQKIAEAMQMGVIDPTAGTLAGMFIDRMRGAAQAEAAPQQTVAQQIFSPQPQMPQGLGQMPMGAPPAPMAPAGLGATPEAAAMPAPEMPVPGMAMGGVASLSVPDDMFDEPSNGSFAGGGLVAFARGGGTGFDDFYRAIIQQESGGRYGIPNAEGSGAMGIGQIMPDTARAIAKRLKREYRPDLMAGDDEAAREYQDALTREAVREAWSYGGGDPSKSAAYYFAGPDRKGWGPKTQKYSSDILGRLGLEGAPMPREADTTTAAGRSMSAEDSIAFGQKMFAGLPREALERAKAVALEELDPANIEKQAKYDTAQALATLGFDLMSPEDYKGEGIIGSIGKAAKAAMGVYGDSKKERKAAKNEAVRTLMALEDVDRKTAMAGVELGIDVYKSGMATDAAERALAFQEKELKFRQDVSAQEMALARQKLSAEVAALRSKGADVNTSVFQMFMSGDKALKEAAKEWLKLNGKGSSPLLGLEGEGAAPAGPWTQYQ
jgi:hypothetical protein